MAKLKRIVPFSSGDVNGAVRRYYPTGELSAVEAWKNGKTDGNIEHYYQDGELKFRGVRRDTFWRDTLCWFYRNGELKDFKVYNQPAKWSTSADISRMARKTLELSTRFLLVTQIVCGKGKIILLR
jgi:hypothetical protein